MRAAWCHTSVLLRGLTIHRLQWRDVCARAPRAWLLRRVSLNCAGWLRLWRYGASAWLALWLCGGLQAHSAPVADIAPRQAPPQGVINVVYPPPMSAIDRRQAYGAQLLALALGKSGAAYALRAGNVVMPQDRALKSLEDSKGVDVVWCMTTREREQALLPVRIPIDKGLLGWRVPMVRASDAERFKSVRSLGDLQAFVAGQEHDWPDVAILESNGLRVNRGTSYEGLFRMLAAGRFDYLPRSIEEAWDEQSARPALRLAIEAGFVLHYPAAKYFFVNKHNTALAAAIETGLRRAIQDGSFDRLFQQHNGKHIQQARLHRRSVIEMKNPLLPPLTPLSTREFWFHLSP